MKVTVSRKAHFNAAHRLYNSEWTDARNATVFGKCANPNYHGHNYELIVSVKGEIHPETGFVMDMKILKYLIKIKALFFLQLVFLLVLITQEKVLLENYSYCFGITLKVII